MRCYVDAHVIDGLSEQHLPLVVRVDQRSVLALKLAVLLLLLRQTHAQLLEHALVPLLTLAPRTTTTTTSTSRHNKRIRASSDDGSAATALFVLVHHQNVRLTSLLLTA